jgi:hypothetical protein
VSPSTLASAYRAMINIIPRVVAGRVATGGGLPTCVWGNESSSRGVSTIDGRRYGGGAPSEPLGCNVCLRGLDSQGEPIGLSMPP